jgi:hypothetical protein
LSRGLLTKVCAVVNKWTPVELTKFVHNMRLVSAARRGGVVATWPHPGGHAGVGHHLLHRLRRVDVQLVPRMVSPVATVGREESMACLIFDYPLSLILCSPSGT